MINVTDYLEVWPRALYAQNWLHVPSRLRSMQMMDGKVALANSYFRGGKSQKLHMLLEPNQELVFCHFEPDNTTTFGVWAQIP